MEHTELLGKAAAHSAFSQKAEWSWHCKGPLADCGSLTGFSKLIWKQTTMMIRIRQAADIFSRYIHTHQGRCLRPFFVGLLKSRTNYLLVKHTIPVTPLARAVNSENILQLTTKIQIKACHQKTGSSLTKGKEKEKNTSYADRSFFSCISRWCSSYEVLQAASEKQCMRVPGRNL